MKKFLVCRKRTEKQINKNNKFNEKNNNDDDFFYKNLKIIKEGFNINAFFFGIFWSIYKGLWYESLLIFTLYSVIIFLNNNFIFFSGISCVIASLSLLIYIGISAPDWEIKKIKNKYKLIEVIYAKSKNHAIHRLYNAYKSYTKSATNILNQNNKNNNYY